eukprot:3563657-Heterocapsa_arctica.AAC.1
MKARKIPFSLKADERPLASHDHPTVNTIYNATPLQTATHHMLDATPTHFTFQCTRLLNVGMRLLTKLARAGRLPSKLFKSLVNFRRGSRHGSRREPTVNPVGPIEPGVLSTALGYPAEGSGHLAAHIRVGSTKRRHCSISGTEHRGDTPSNV